MKKQVLTITAITVLAVAMTACSKTQTGNNITPTTVEAETTTAPTAILTLTVEPTVTSTATPMVEPTATPEPIATSTPVPTSTPAPTPTNTPVPTSTPTPTPLPYAEEKGIIIENKTEFESSFMHYVRGWESEEETAFPGLTTQNAGCKVVIDSVTQKAAEEEGYTTFTVQYHLECAVKQSVDIREGDTCGRIVWLTPAFSICDYYTGFSGINNLIEGDIGSGETVLNWNGNEIKVKFTLDQKFEWSLGEWIQESDNIYTMLCPARLDHTVLVTVPDGYDGIMLKMEKEGLVGQGKAAVEESLKRPGTGELLSEGEKTEDFHFIRLTDIAKKTTEAPVADTKDWKTVLRELHSLETYEEREAYVAKLDKSVYKVEQTENFDLIDKCNSYEGEMYVRNEFGRVQEETYVVYDANYDTVAQYLADELPEDFWKTYGPEKYAFKDKTWRIATEYTYDELPADFWDFFEFNGCTYKDYNVIFGPCAYVLVDDSFETVREYAINELPEDFWNDYDINSTFYYDGYMALVQYPDLPYYIELEWVDVTTKGSVYADLEGILAYNWEPFGETAYLMTITNVATGETDPWGVCYGRSVTMEEAVNVYESSYASEWGPALVIDYEMVYGCEPAHIKTWDTLKYYEDLVNLN